MQHDILMAIAILLPVLMAVLAYAVRHYQARGFIVIATAAVLTANAIMFIKAGSFEFTPRGEGWNEAVTILDFLMLCFFVYAGISLRNVLVFIFALLQLAPLAYWEFVMKAKPVVEPAFVVDHLAIVMVLIISVIGSLICVFGIKYIQDHEEHAHLKKSRQSRFLFWMVIFLGAMNGLVCANNLYWLYFFWEMTTLCSFQLIGHDLTKEALNNAARALWMNSLGGVAFVFGIIYLYMNAGGPAALSMQALIKGSMPQVIVVLPIALLCFTGFTKAAQLPFQSWLLGAMVAPTPVSALLHSSTMVKAGVYLVVRLAPSFSQAHLGTMGVFLGEIIALVGGFTFLGASALAISQHTGKKVLAYSTIANLGLIIACAGINTPLSIAAAIILIIFHAVSKALLFLCAGTIEHIIWSREIDDMEALADKAPMTTLITGLGMLSMFLPPFGMLLGKWMAIEATTFVTDNTAIQPGIQKALMTVPIILVVVCLALASAATIVFWAKWFGRLLQVLPRMQKKREKMSPGYLVPLIILLVGVFVFSIGVGPIYRLFVQYAVTDVTPYSMLYTQAGSIWLENPGTLMNPAPPAVGAFPVVLLFVILVAALGVPFLLISLKKEELRPVYMCGDQVGALDTDEYMTAGDQKAQVQLSSYYLQKTLGEGALNPWVNTIAVNLLVVLFGIALGVMFR
jgi:ech hydrogenase subunit A